MSKLLLICVFLFTVATSFSQIVNIPDPNFKAHLVNYTNPVIDTNGDGEIQVSEAETVDDTILFLQFANISDLTGLEAFVNLQGLNIKENFVTEIDVSSLTELIDLFVGEENLESIILPNTTTLNQLNVSNTQITTIDVSNNPNLEILYLTANNLSEIDLSQNNNLKTLGVSLNNITNIDITNLTQLQTLYFNRSNVSNIDLSNNPNLQRLDMFETNLTSLDVTNNTLLNRLDIHDTPITNINLSNNVLLTKVFIHNTLIETIDFQNNILISELNISNLNIDNLDISMLSSLWIFYCNNTNLTELDFSQNTDLTQVFLIFSQLETLDFSNSSGLQLLRTDGSLGLESLNIKNVSLPDLFINASNNPNLNFICVDDIPLAIAQNFNIPPFTTFIDDCALATGELNFIEGAVTYDANDNNCGTGAVPLNNYLINANNGTSNFANTTDETGAYSIKVSEGNYTTQVLGLPPYYDTTPATASSTFVGFDQTDTADFCVQANTTANDLTVSIFPVTEARPGFEAEYEIIYENVGTTTLTGEVTVAFSDVQVDFVSATPAPNNQTSNSLTFNVGSLTPFQQESIFATFLLEQPPVNQSGQLLPYTVTINPTAGDATPEDNEFYFPQIIVNSFDPNDKTCIQGNQVLFADADNYLHYIVRFQNLGTASAINVRVVDVLDELLDFSTFRVLSASHEMRTTLNDGQIDFIFDNINLPAENNRADIYFDFNAPVLTNTTSTTFVDVLGIEEVSALDIVVFPNPASTRINIQSSSTIEAVEIWNTLGQQLNTLQISANKKQIDISALASGLYFMKISTGDGEGVFRIVKE